MKQKTSEETAYDFGKMNKKPSVLVLGGVSYNKMIYLDRLPEANPGTLFASHDFDTVGSTGAGKAFSLNKLGFDTCLFGMLGEDEYGEKIKAAFVKEKLRFEFSADPKGTKRHVNLMDKDGRRISIYVSHGSYPEPVDAGQVKCLIDEYDVVALNILPFCKQFIPYIKSQNKKIWVDIHDFEGQAYHHDFYEAGDFVLMSSDKLPDYKKFMEELMQQGKELVVCTHGKEGASALDKFGNWIDTPILDEFKRVDTNGAGDSFLSGLMFGYYSDYDLKKSMQMATIISGLTITSPMLFHEQLSPALVQAYFSKYYE